MIAKTLSAAAVMAIAGSASAQFLAPTHTSTGAKIAPTDNVTAMSRGTTGSVHSFDVTGINSWDPEGSANNEVYLFDLAAAAGQPSGTSITMVGLGWDVFQSTVGPSWGSEMVVSFADSAANVGVYLTPNGTGAPLAGSVNSSSGGILDLTDNSIPNLVLPDGVLRLEFFDSYDDYPGGIDGHWDSGTLDIAIAPIPAPSAMGLLGLAGVAALGRKRR
ncbi:MAG: PEP-CTERM sorting domain-containing protein [Phycisphaerales bacterium]|nr:PEP-CTERM sorting domain-containing protein [Phycisphaerales bacterium]